MKKVIVAAGRMSGTVWIGLLLLMGVLAMELLAPELLKEGFVALTPANKPLITAKNPEFIQTFAPRRGDVGPNQEATGYFQDKRYFADYTDVQRYGANNDFCRLVTTNKADPAMSFFACALAGTKGTSSVAFKTRTAKDGLRLSRDDYMRDILKDGRNAYCRILKDSSNTFQPLCLRAVDTGFSTRDELDPLPPPEIDTLLNFYESCKIWLRLRDDMIDYIGNAVVQYKGNLGVDETPKPAVTRGLEFNGRDQFVRIGDSDDLTLGNKINLRTIRAFSFWVRFDAFTNNAHIFDFGDGAGKNNVFFGLLGKGDPNESDNGIRPKPGCESTVPVAPSGAQFCPEVTAQTLLATSSADVDDFTCVKPEVYGRRLAPSNTRTEMETADRPMYATLLYEVWDGTLRKMQMKMNKAIKINTWSHIVITATTMDAMRPDIDIWVNGVKAGEQLAGFLPQNKSTTNNYLGKSNWANEDSLYEIRDELFQGNLFDFRMYSAPLSRERIDRIQMWGKDMLGLTS